MEKNRCPWANTSQEMKNYHDNIWGKVVKDDQQLFRSLTFEIFQSGLSWNTILKKIDYFDEAFEYFDIEKVSKFDNQKLQELIQNPKIIRHKMKIEATINNAKKIKEIQNMYGSFSEFIWKYVVDTPIINPWSEMYEVPSKNFLSDKITDDLKMLGFQFIGSTVIYARLQSIGMINDHLLSCDFKYSK